MQKIVPHLWFDKEADEAAKFYMSLFEGSKLKDKTILNDTPSGSVDMITIELAGQEFMLLSAGPLFKFTPAVSFLIACSSVEEVEGLWEKLIENGAALMPIDAYPFSEKYGWVIDKYGLSWQVMYMGDFELKQKITPTLMFVGDQCGNAEEAIQFYTTLFKDSSVGHILRYGEDAAPNGANAIQHVDFVLENQTFAAMDSAYEHNFTFNEAISLMVMCDTQEEIDYYWEKLSAVPEAEQCGWLKDKYGFSWQIVPTMMNVMMQTKDAAKLVQVTEAFLKMKKFDIAEAIRAYEK
ncbi:VOC family protein [Desulfosporosinus sp. BICA1-9]|uniref:VOC family protein n=1 Tax=Desulfosporosinus sp. BICA1-9 TaxID=1531958 RepID=UPI00054C2C55|nr:VOC family protein [Desulfosporosinus sp. BICA1-9]KJS46692.1 MAG: 3-demethylubiquinone-9 3-methyltransferase [Peptococcaceae bacterium BRH_c23]KJS77817.1 MAG: 3-demethylubiquinone-9 3-methyltransferase [Desulfosporosinus sp. BICA1-9]HBW34771.1 VOC family protein [Desulfosporosinus sp.]